MHGVTRKYLLKPSPPDPRDHVHVPLKATHAAAAAPPSLPRRVDLRPEMPPVLDQSTLGSCASNSASNCLRHLLRKERLAEFQPSRLYLYWNTRVNIEGSPAGEDTGVCIRDVCKAIKRYHVCDEAVWPYDIAKFSVGPSLEAYKNAALHATIQYAYVPQALHALQQSLADGLPIMVGIQVYESFESQRVAETGVVPMPDTTKEQCLGGHAVLAVGYNDDTRTFLAMNSWGASWGKAGFFEIPYAYLLNPDLASDFWVLSFFK